MGGGGFGEAVGKGPSYEHWRVDVNHTGRVEVSVDELDNKDNRNLKEQLKSRIAERARIFRKDRN
jgi:hypothetical protein